MADRLTPRRIGANLVAFVLAFALAACVSSTPTESEGPSRAALEDELRQQARIMQKTILEGAATGAAAGTLLDRGFGIGGDDNNAGFRIGLGAGALAGTYVGHIQTKYFRRERRLEAIREDLDRNAAEMQTTLNVMRQVMEIQRAELASLRTRVEQGAASSDQLNTEIQAANANLAEMQKAIDGASGRQAEFGDARRLTLRRGDQVSPIDPELTALANQVSAMKGIANDLATSL